MSQLAPFLRKISLFRSLKSREITTLAKSIQTYAYPAASQIFKKGDKADHMFIVLSGKVKIFSRSDTKIRTTFAYVHSGDFFGEMALLTPQPRSAGAETVEDSELLLLHRREFTRLLRENAAFSADLLHNMSERLRRADEQIENILFQNILGRLSRLLCRMARDTGEKTRGGLLIRSSFTRQELADMVGTTREPLSRALTLLRRAEAIRLQKDGIFLPNLEKIEGLAGMADNGKT